MAGKKMSLISILASLVLWSTIGGVDAQAIEVTVTTVDDSGESLEGRVSVRGSFGTIGGDSPFTYDQADGTSASFLGGWRAGQGSFGTVIWKGKTYNFDAVTQELTIEESPTGETLVNIIFEPIDVTVSTVDGDGNLLDGKVWVQNNGGMCKIYRITGDSGLTYVQANGGAGYGGTSFHGGWRAGETGLGSVIWQGNTYNFDALTQELTVEESPNGETLVNIIFEPIDVTVLTVDQDGYPLDGMVWVQNNGGMCKIYRITGDSPLTYEQANGGAGYGGTLFHAGWCSTQAGFGYTVIWKDTTYRLDVPTQELTTESTPGVNRVNFVFTPTLPLIVSPSSGSVEVVGVPVQLTAHIEGQFSGAVWTINNENWTEDLVIQGSISDSLVSNEHAFTEAGIYSIALTVTGPCGYSYTATTVYDDPDSPAFVVIYDPEGGFVTGGGWIYSPEGAYVPDPSLEGKANFGFVSKYKKGATVPTGQTEFVFQAGDLNFHSSSYDWLVVNQAGTNAQFKGSGTINGEGAYKFMLWAGDSSPDTFRIRIWTEDEYGVETDVYDNGSDQEIGGGSIVIHAQ